jgi:hypothetical protein
MDRTDTEKTSYERFQDDLTAYRRTRVLITAYEKGVFAVLAAGPLPADVVCDETAMDRAFGTRFLDVLAAMGFLERREGRYGLADWARPYLVPGNAMSQDAVFRFERGLIRSWETLGDVLTRGERVFGTEAKGDGDYRNALDRYLGAMDNAAVVRSPEMWDVLAPQCGSGVILEAGAGSGAYLKSFLVRNSGWRGIFCDLADVVARAKKDPGMVGIENRLEYRICNLLDDTGTQSALAGVSADIVLFSNVVHCQGEPETRGMLARVVPFAAAHGRVVIHDFFSDAHGFGALYDLHMMLNTFNGRTYTTAAVTGWLEDLGFSLSERHELPSRSTALVFER